MEPFIAEIKMFAGNFAPRGYAFCNGQLLSISQNTALFSLIGTTYGGDGRTTFALPDLRSRVPIHPGTGAGLTTRRLGERLGTETNTLTVSQLPNHTHAAALSGNATVEAYDDGGDNDSAVGHNFATAESDIYTTNNANGLMTPGNVNLSGVSVQVGSTGGSQWVNNMQPSLGINFIIALVGTFPSRN